MQKRMFCNKQHNCEMKKDWQEGARAGKELGLLGQTDTVIRGQHGAWAGPHSSGTIDYVAQKSLASYSMAL